MTENFEKFLTYQLKWQKGKSVCSWSSRLEFDPESCQTNVCNIYLLSFRAWRSASMERCGEQAGKFIVVPLGKAGDRQLVGKLIIAFWSLFRDSRLNMKLY